MNIRTRRRLQLLGVASLFAAPILVGIALVLAGWMPGTKSYGLPILPQRSVASVPVHLDNGQPFAWRDRSFRWTLVALPGPDCAARCTQALDMIERARITLNQNADKLRLLYLGSPPNGTQTSELHAWRVSASNAPELDDLRSHARDSLAAVLIMPDGVALTHYPPGFDPDGLKKDLQKVVR
jgi:cytochrome oxidase Cu insertion factor (SCO1/SenC/PrrC family)